MEPSAVHQDFLSLSPVDGHICPPDRSYQAFLEKTPQKNSSNDKSLSDVKEHLSI